MNTKYLIGGLIIIVIVVGIMLNGGKKEVVAPAVNTPAPTATIPTSAPTTTATTITVTYDANGFTPNKPIIKVGDTVHFVNKTSHEMEVASNPHPTHTDYPAFDQGKGAFDKQNTFDFTFTKPGVWGYHNHESARDRGEIIVE